jgi:23S rRNA pseudouridine1911/1915/1917 synthase
MEPTIIFENEHFLIIDKPSGVVVHPFDYSTERTLLDFLMDHSPSSLSIQNVKILQDGRILNLGGIVHKLDRETSGIMVIAKTVASYASLKEQFSSHTIKKTYRALVEGLMEHDTFRIDAPLGRNKKEYKQSVNPKNPRGELRSAVTDYKVITRGEGVTLVELLPETGRTHQLRAHMSYVGHPIVGDKAYGSTHESSRIMLHAQSLSFTLLDQQYLFEVPTPFGVSGL